MSLKRKVFNQCVLSANDIWMPDMASYETLVKKLVTSQEAMGRKMLNVKLKDRVHNTISWEKNQSNRYSPIDDHCKIEIGRTHCPNEKQQMDHNSKISDQNGVSLLYITLEIHHSGWELSISQIKGVRSVERPKRRWRDDICGALFVCWLLNVPATCECISGTDLLRQFYVLPH